jgi:hypothetical protein
VTLTHKSLEIFKLSTLSHVIKVETYRAREVYCSVITARSLYRSEPTADSPTAVCGAEAATSMKCALRSVMYATAKDALVVIIVLVGFLVSIYQLQIVAL